MPPATCHSIALRETLAGDRGTRGRMAEKRVVLQALQVIDGFNCSLECDGRMIRKITRKNVTLITFMNDTFQVSDGLLNDVIIIF